jgi:phosphatidylglycerophosphate synthase
VTLAVLSASTGNALDPTDAARLADDLTAALAAAGASTVERLTGDGTVTGQMRDIARIAVASAEPLLICADNLVANPSLLWTLATEPAGRSTALVISGAGGGLREDRGRLVAAADGTIRFLGAMCIAPVDLPLLAAAADHAAATGPAADGVPAAVVATDVRNAVDALLPALLDAGLVPVATPVRLLHAERVETTAELAAATAATAAVDEDAARLRLAVKDKDDFFTTYAVSSWSPLITKWCARLGLTPTGVTGLSVLFAVAAALAFWQASRPAMIAGAVLLYLGFVLDCVDGQLARYTRRFGVWGGWLDTMADRAKEYAVYAGLAAGAERIGLPYAWPLAITAILLQTVRHMTDAWYGALHDRAAALPHATPATGVGARLSAASTRVQADTGSVAYWLKRIVVFPIGERWALIAVLAATANGRVALAAVVIWGLLAAAYTLGLRSLRSVSMRVGVLDTVDTSRHRDDGLLVRAVLSRAGLPAPLAFALVAALAALTLVIWLLIGGPPYAKPILVAVAVLVLAAGLPARARHGGPLDWLVPATLRAAEYLFVVAVGLIGSVPPPVVFGLLFALALRHYDLIARMEKGAPAGSGTRAVLGWDGRVVLLTVAALAGVATLGEAVLAVAVGGGFLIAAIADWRREGGAR